MPRLNHNTSNRRCDTTSHDERRYVCFGNIMCQKQRIIFPDTICRNIGEPHLDVPKASIHKPQALPRALRLASAVPLLWYLCWSCYDIAVWSKPLLQEFWLNLVGVILSSGIFFAVSILGAHAKELKKEENTGIEMKRRLQTLKGELTELRRQYEKTIASLKTLQQH